MKKTIPILLLILSLSLFMISCKDKNKKADESAPEEEKEPLEEIPTEKGKLYFNYHFNNGEEDLKIEVEEPDKVVLPTPIKDGHSLNGWYIDSTLYKKVVLEEIELPSDSNDKIVNLYAGWKINKYTVTFKCDNTVVSTQSIEYNKSAKAPTAKLLPGYLFSHWDQDFSVITGDLEVNAVYIENSHNGIVLVVLGNYMNDDGSISATMKKRLDLALEANEAYMPDYIVVTGGLANQKAGITEAQAMYNYLVDHGVDGSKIIKENKSLSTQYNAIYTMEKLEDVDFHTLVIVSTIEHFLSYGALTYFNNAAKDNAKIKEKDIRIMIYTNNA